MARDSVGIRPIATSPVTETIVRPFQEFARLEASAGLLLVAAAVAALVWANSPWADAYHALWQLPATVGVGDLVLRKSLLKWVNDGLMAVFFFVVGMEIKRELVVGELSDRRRASLPIVAALGGAVAPALIYIAVNRHGSGAAGWGVPMATDIAFALGVLTLLGSRVPTGLKVFLTALAIADDVAAVLIIALFYTASVASSFLALAALFLAALAVANLLGARNPLIYGVLGLCLWLAFVHSGVHATVAGVLLALTVPIRSRIDAAEFERRARVLLDAFETAGEDGHAVDPSGGQRDIVHTLEKTCEQVETPLQRMEHFLHPWVSYAILPMFALANAGVSLPGRAADALTHPVTIGAALGLVLGKQLGIAAAAWLAVRLGVAELPTGVTWRHIYGAAWLGGIGFTMSLFIAGLAFTDPAMLAAAKIGILGGSLVSAAVGCLILVRTSRCLRSAVAMSVALAVTACAPATAPTPEQSTSRPAGAAPSTPTADLPPELATYLDDGLALIEAHSLYGADDDWAELREMAHRAAQGARTTADLHGVLRMIVGATGDRHGYVAAPAGTMSVPGERPPTTGTRTAGMPDAVPPDAVPPDAVPPDVIPPDAVPPDVPLPGSEIVAGRIGHLTVRTFVSPDDAAARAYALALRDAIAGLDAAGVCGWLVDVRYNQGGNGVAMLAGLSPLLGDGVYGWHAYPDGARLEWRWSDDRMHLGDRPLIDLAGTSRAPDLSSAPVAVLTNEVTTSAGEMVAIAFRGRPATRSFGQATLGRTTAPEGFTLADGAILGISVAYFADRDGRVYTDRVVPDRRIVAHDSPDARSRDAPPIAVDWLLARPECAGAAP